MYSVESWQKRWGMRSKIQMVHEQRPISIKCCIDIRLPKIMRIEQEQELSIKAERKNIGQLKQVELTILKQ